jgi:hypothetical protein
MALETIQDFIDRTRTILLDEIEPYRYPDRDLVEALNMAIFEIRRLRPDIVRPFFRGSVPQFSTSDKAAVVPVDVQYRPAILYYICGQAQLRDDEITQDSRAAAFLNKFTAQMLTIQS